MVSWLGRALAAALALASPAAGPTQAPPPARAGAASPPLEAFAQLPFLSEALLSPDGTRIAARITHQGREWVGVWELAAPRDRQPAMVEVANLDSFAWAGDRQILLFGTTISIRIRYGTISIGQARSVTVHDLTADKRTALDREGGIIQDIIFTDPEGSYVLASRLQERDDSPGVDRIDMATGAAVRVQEPVRGVWTWFADNAGVVRVGIDYGERRTRIYYRAEPAGRLTRLETRQDLLEDSIVESVRLVAGNGRGVMATNAVSGRFAVYEYDFANATRGAALFEHPEVDVTSVVFAPDGSVDGFTYDDDRPRVRWTNPAMSRLQARLDAALPGRVNRVIDRSRDGNRLLVFSSSAEDPGTYYVFDQRARRLEIFASPYDLLQGQTFAPVRPIEYRSRDGLTIRGYLTLPRGRGERALPLIVMPHGGPFVRDRWVFDPQVQFLASRGYAVLQMNYRGSTGYGRDFVERGYGQLGAGMIDDMEDGLAWAVREGIADRARVCIMGFSYGGYAAIWAAMRNPSLYRCAISWAGPTDLPAMMRHDTRFTFAQRYVRERRRQLRGDEDVSLNAISPLRHAERLRVPLLVGHGQQDNVVPHRQSVDLVRALERRRISVESVFYRKSGHNFTDVTESADFLRRVQAFLERHNPPGDVPATAPVGVPSETTSR